MVRMSWIRSIPSKVDIIQTPDDGEMNVARALAGDQRFWFAEKAERDVTIYPRPKSNFNTLSGPSQVKGQLYGDVFQRLGQLAASAIMSVAFGGRQLRQEDGAVDGRSQTLL